MKPIGRTKTSRSESLTLTGLPPHLVNERLGCTEVRVRFDANDNEP
jgi:hypothetical protein